MSGLAKYQDHYNVTGADKAIQYSTWWRQALDGKTINPREALTDDR